MKTIDTSGSFEEAINKSSPATQELARKVRELIHEVYPEVVEVPWPKQQIIGYGIGLKKMSEHFCYIDAYKEHANLGFNHGASLDDPEELLQGEGKRFRHIKIDDPRILKRPALEDLIRTAVAERKRNVSQNDRFSLRARDL